MTQQIVGRAPRIESEHEEDDTIIENEELQRGTFTVYAQDVSLRTIYQNLKTKMVQATTKTGEVRLIPLWELREDNTKGGEAIYTKDIFPSTWTEKQIMDFYKDNPQRQCDWLTHDTAYPRKRVKFVMSPEAPPQEQ